MIIEIEKEALKKLASYTELAVDEIGGLLKAIELNGRIIIKDTLLLKQEAGVGSFEINDEAMFNFLIKHKKNAKEYIGWWHSHGTMSTFWSCTDDKTFEDLTKMNQVCIGVVTNKKKKWKWRICKLINNKIYEDKNISTIFPKIDMKEIEQKKKELEKETKRKVKKEKIEYFEYEDEIEYNKEYWKQIEEEIENDSIYKTNWNF